jgi:hypothetical protein
MSEPDQPPELENAAPTQPGEEEAAEEEAVRQAVQDGAQLESLPSTSDLSKRDRKQDIDLKRTYAKTLLMMMGAQLVVANAVFIAYAWAGVHWNIEAAVINVWLAATLIEVIGVVLVVTRYLFPRRDDQA